jgi:hypothetical protein
MLTMTKKSSTAEWTDVARAEALLREAVEARRALEHWRQTPRERPRLEAWQSALLAGLDQGELATLRRELNAHPSMNDHPGLYPEDWTVRRTAADHIRRRDWPAPPAQRPDHPPFDRVSPRRFRLLVALACEDAATTHPEVFGALGSLEEKRRQEHELTERALEAEAALRAVPLLLRRGLAASLGLLVDPRPDVDLDRRLLDYAAASRA